MTPTLRSASSVVPGFGSSGTGSCTDTAKSESSCLPGIGKWDRQEQRCGMWGRKVRKAAEQPRPVPLPRSTASGAVKQLKCTDQHLGLENVRE